MAQTYTTKKLPGVPVVYATLHSDYVMERDVAESTRTAIALLDRETSPVFYIVDLTALNLDLTDIMRGSNAASGSDTSVYRHPMVREVLFVSDEEIVALSAAGLDSNAFGHVKAHTFPTREAALDYVHSVA